MLLSSKDLAFTAVRGRELDGQLQKLIDTVEIAHDEFSIRNAIRRFTLTSGFERYAYIHVHAHDVVAFSDYPVDWQKMYINGRYSTIDPVVTRAKRKAEMFAWDADEAERTREVRRFFSSAIGFGIRTGVSIPIRTSFGRIAMITLASNKQRVKIPAWDPVQAALALSYIHVHLSLTSLVSNRIPGVALSTQEATSLSWSSHGKSMNVIGELLGIKPRTVQFYLDKARAKLGASNLQQAVRIAIEKKLI